MTPWTTKNIPSLSGRTAVITGATSGLGYETALALAAAGACVIIASRNEVKGTEVAAKIRAAHPQSSVSFERLDLASLASVETCAARIADAAPRIDLLINNAGIMAIPDLHRTADGFEMQFGANYLGHFALTLRLMPQLLAGVGTRVVCLSSLAHRSGSIDFTNLNAERRYHYWRAYAQSKIAMLMFAFELDRRARENGWPLMATAAHPGFATTGLQSAGPSLGRDSPPLFQRGTEIIAPWFAQDAAQGALPTLYAATSPEAKAAILYGPDGFYELKGLPRESKIADKARDKAVQRRLWDVSEQLVGLTLDRDGHPHEIARQAIAA